MRARRAAAALRFELVRTLRNRRFVLLSLVFPVGLYCLFVASNRGVANLGGDPVADIASALSLSEGTVRNYLSAAIAKTGARNRVEAARLAAEQGWL